MSLREAEISTSSTQKTFEVFCVKASHVFIKRSEPTSRAASPPIFKGMKWLFVLSRSLSMVFRDSKTVPKSILYSRAKIVAVEGSEARITSSIRSVEWLWHPGFPSCIRLIFSNSSTSYSKNLQNASELISFIWTRFPRSLNTFFEAKTLASSTRTWCSDSIICLIKSYAKSKSSTATSASRAEYKFTLCGMACTQAIKVSVTRRRYNLSFSTKAFVSCVFSFCKLSSLLWRISSPIRIIMSLSLSIWLIGLGVAGWAVTGAEVVMSPLLFAPLAPDS